MNIKKIVIILVILVAITSVFIYKVKYSIALQPSAYVGGKLEFSINLPVGWNVQNTTASNTLFGDGKNTIAVSRFARAPLVENAISFMGRDEFYVFLTDQLSLDIKGYTVIATSTALVENLPSLKVVGTYTGQTSNKKVNNTVYITLTPYAYYLISSDTYDSTSKSRKDIITQSLNTARLLNVGTTTNEKSI